MNAMGYDAVAIGNHEFNYGLPALSRAVAQSRFPFLAANAYTVGGERAFPASRIVARGGVRVAIVGATNPGAMLWDRDNLAGRLHIRDIVPEVAREVRAVRDRADAVVVVMHSGLGERSSYDTVATDVSSENVGARVAREVPGVDLIVIGHSHREIADTVINGVTIVQPRNWATSVASRLHAAPRGCGGGAQGLVRAADTPSIRHPRCDPTRPRRDGTVDQPDVSACGVARRLGA
jgi:2',3'-cyclic-nucleotide 2'-phosphodiesterase/3'-nucleotidase